MNNLYVISEGEIIQIVDDVEHDEDGSDFKEYDDSLSLDIDSQYINNIFSISYRNHETLTMAIAGEPKPSESHFNVMEKTHQKSTFRANSKKRVLVVDDDAFIRAFLYDALSMLDYEVATASGGAEGFTQYGQNPFDLVITDCKMPGTDGWQLAALIKQVSAHTPIIMVTGQSPDEIMPKMQGGNIDFLIFKPFELNKLFEAVRASFEISDHQQSWGYEESPSKGSGPHAAVDR